VAFLQASTLERNGADGKEMDWRGRDWSVEERKGEEWPSFMHPQWNGGDEKGQDWKVRDWKGFPSGVHNGVERSGPERIGEEWIGLACFSNLGRMSDE